MFEEEIIKLLKQAGVSATKEQLEVPPRRDFGDFSFPVFNLAKEQKKNPNELAVYICEKIKIGGILKEIQTKGPYVNFFLNYEKISKKTLERVTKEKEKFGSSNIGKRKKILIEFSNPNTAHGLHIGHARATMLGESLANIIKFCGYNVIKANYYGDFGKQMAKTIVAYLQWGEGVTVDKKSDLWMWDLYKKFHDEVASKPALEDEAKEVLQRLEEQDAKMIKIWKEIREMALSGIKETYKRLGVSFDVELFESEYYNLGKDIVQRALKKGIAKESQGAIVTNLEKYGLPDTVLIKADGTTVYQTRDLGLAVKNFKDFKLDGRIYVVDVRQSLHFKQVFKILELLEYKWAKNLYHLGFGFVNLPEGLMASRTGKVVPLDTFLDEMRALTYQEVNQRNAELDQKKKLELAEKIGTGALIFALLKIEPEQNIIFKKEEVVQFEGDTGPYVQYAHTRAASILSKAGKWKRKFSFKEINESETKLIKKLSEFPDVVEHSAKDMRPHYVCNYAYDLATIFNNFYQFNPVLKVDEEMKNFRLTLVEATKQVLENSLRLIGIQIPEKM
jgi:arginyl-tRNA synthetase